MKPSCELKRLSVDIVFDRANNHTVWILKRSSRWEAVSSLHIFVSKSGLLIAKSVTSFMRVCNFNIDVELYNLTITSITKIEVSCLEITHNEASVLSLEGNGVAYWAIT